VYPAVEGVINVFEKGIKNGVKKFVLISSFTAIRGSKYKLSFNEDTWADPGNLPSIEKSKVFAERTAYYMVNEKNK
jgi:nucleoside-diphosphate-sugar epimerase